MRPPRRCSTVTDTLLGRSLPQASPTLAETVPGPGERTQTETALERVGSVRYYDVRVIPRTARTGSYGHLIYSDITSQRRAREHLQVLQRVLRHNLRNEMNVVLGMAEEIRPMPTNASDSPYYEHSDDIVDRSTRSAESPRL